jgi:hypothetical protein
MPEGAEPGSVPGSSAAGGAAGATHVNPFDHVLSAAANMGVHQVRLPGQVLTL